MRPVRSITATISFGERLMQPAENVNIPSTTTLGFTTDQISHLAKIAYEDP